MGKNPTAPISLRGVETRVDAGAASLPGSGPFGLDTPPERAAAVILPVPFDATASYRKGAARGPEAVIAASWQVELHDPVFGEPWRGGIALRPADRRITAWNEEASACAAPVIEAGGVIAGDAELERCRARVDAIGAALDAHLYGLVAAELEAGRLPVVLGGDHSVPMGAYRAAAERHPGLGLLHFDAHCDLRRAYEGFRHSHASIIDNALTELDGIARVVQVGVRDVCPEELERIARSEGRVRTLFDHEWAEAKLSGANLRELAGKTLAALPDVVWITFDVDGLDPALCPHTGTPVPGGLTWHETALWLSALIATKKRVVGVDLVEVAPGPERDGGLDGIVGARLLYRLIGTALR